MTENSLHEDSVNQNPGNGMVRYFCGKKWQEGPAHITTNIPRPEGVIYDFNGRYKKLIEDKNAPRNP